MKTPCVPGSRIQRIDTGNADAAVVALCRKYSKQAGEILAFEPWEFSDIAVIAHNRKNGATCFFQSHTSKGPQDGRTVPSPMQPTLAAAKFWVPPKPAAAGQTQYFMPFYDCTSCHDADPFIVTPYLADQITALGVLDPLGGHDVDRHGLWSDKDQRMWVAKAEKPGAASGGQSCAGCHRMGAGSLQQIRKYAFDQGGNINLHGFMPLGNTQDAVAWDIDYRPAIDEIIGCLTAKEPALDCERARAGTIAPPP